MQRFKEHFYTDWSFYKRMLAITIPIALQNVISLGVNMMDIIMLGQLGDVAIASANLGGQLFTILDVMGFGLASGAAVLIAQYWGKRDMLRIRQIFALTLRVVLVISSLFALVGHFLPEKVLAIYTTDPAVIESGAAYLKLLSISFVLFSFSNCYIMCLRAVEQVRISMVVYGCSFFINVFFNYCLIFGNLGFPRMGIAGAAIATLIARIIECAIIVVYVFRIDQKIRFQFRLDDENDAAKTGAQRIENGKVNDDVAGVVHGRDLLGASEALDRRFCRLNEGYLKPQEIEYINTMRTMKMKALHDRLTSIAR